MIKFTLNKNSNTETQNPSCILESARERDGEAEKGHCDAGGSGGASMHRVGDDTTSLVHSIHRRIGHGRLEYQCQLHHLGTGQTFL